MNVNLPITQGVWENISKGFKTADSFSCFPKTVIKILLVVSTLVTAVVTPIFLLLDSFYLIAKGCPKKELPSTQTSTQSQISQTGTSSSMTNVFTQTIKPVTGSKTTEKTVDKDKKPVLDKPSQDQRPPYVPPTIDPIPVKALQAQHYNQMVKDIDRPEGDKKFFRLKEHKPDDEFVGVDGIITLNKEQTDQFKKWAKKGNWEKFSHQNSHPYDAVAFPVCEKDPVYGFKYSVSLDDIEKLKQNPEFMANYRTCIKLVVQSWGWNLDKNAPVDPKADGQDWDFYEKRLGSIAASLRLFGEWDLFSRLQVYVKEQLYQKDRIYLDGKRLSQLLLGEWNTKVVFGGLD